MRAFNQHIKRTIWPSFESQSPLLVDPHMPGTVVFLEAVAWWCFHELQARESAADHLRASTLQCVRAMRAEQMGP